VYGIDNNTATIEPKVCKPPPIKACGVNDIQNLVCNLTRVEAAGHEQQLTTIANGDIMIFTG